MKPGDGPSIEMEQPGGSAGSARSGKSGASSKVPPAASGEAPVEKPAEVAAVAKKKESEEEEEEVEEEGSDIYEEDFQA